MEDFDSISSEFANANYQTKHYVRLPLFRSILPSNCASLLELGCGSGYFCREAADLGARIICVDSSMELIRIAQDEEQCNPRGIRYCLGDARSLRLNERVDCVASVYVLNHMATQEELLAMCKTAAFHSNYFCSIVPNPSYRFQSECQYERSVTQKDNGPLQDGSVLQCEIKEDGKSSFRIEYYYWSKSTLERVMKDAGFREVFWIPPLVSKEGMQRFGADYWKPYLENPSCMGVIARA